MKRLSLSEVCDKSFVTREDGAKLRSAIEAAWSDAEKIEIDFEDRSIASASFLDESIAVLALDHPIEVIKRRLQPIHMTLYDRRLLNQRLRKREQERVARLEADPAETESG